MAGVSKGWPKDIEVSGVRVRVYRAERMVGGSPYAYFRIGYHEPGYGRRMRDFALEADAIAEAKAVAAKIGAGRNDAITLTRDEVAEFNACRSKLTGTGASLFQAVEFFVANYKADKVVQKTVPEVVEEYLSELQLRKLSRAHLNHETHTGRKFSAAFTGPLASVSSSLFQAWLRRLTLRDGGEPSGRYLRNVHRSFTAMVNFAAGRNYVTREHAAQIAALEAPKAEAPRCEVFTVEEFRRLLEASGDDTRPAVALCGFAGIRTAEVRRLTWADVNLSERVVVVGAHAAKTQSRRVVPLSDAAVAWLAPFADRSGKVFPGDPRRIAEVGASIGIEWKRNGLRHGFCSCRLAVLKNAAETAFEAGNSPVMIQKHYRSLVTEATGKAWFSIMPPTT